MKKEICLLLSLCILSGCSPTSSDSLTENVIRSDISPIEITADNDRTTEVTQFGLQLFSTLETEKNPLISPLSIVSALSMTANGADHGTLSQMEEVFGGTVTDLNNYLYAYRTYLPQGEKYQVNLANSIWLQETENRTISTDFLQTNVNYYHAQVFSELFDNTLPTKVNTWVKENTAGMIEEVLSENTVPTATMYLINALSFDGEWQNIYDQTDIRTNTFTNADGTTSDMDMMYGAEYTYLELEGATGFKKYYSDNAYSFVAFLPDEDVTLQDFVNSLAGESLIDALSNSTDEKVLTTIPKFSVEYEEKLKEVLISLGMVDAFDESLADFSRMVDDEVSSLFIEQVIHKTKIDVDEKGTKAGAVTVVSVAETAAVDPPEIKEVHLTRPFFYMIVDEAHNLPLFMGCYSTAG